MLAETRRIFGLENRTKNGQIINDYICSVTFLQRSVAVRTERVGSPCLTQKSDSASFDLQLARHAPCEPNVRNISSVDCFRPRPNSWT
jgi:hypothetical protein